MEYCKNDGLSRCTTFGIDIIDQKSSADHFLQIEFMEILSAISAKKINVSPLTESLLRVPGAKGGLGIVAAISEVFNAFYIERFRHLFKSLLDKHFIISKYVKIIVVSSSCGTVGPALHIPVLLAVKKLIAENPRVELDSLLLAPLPGLPLNAKNLANAAALLESMDSVQTPNKVFTYGDEKFIGPVANDDFRIYGNSRYGFLNRTFVPPGTDPITQGAQILIARTLDQLCSEDSPLQCLSNENINNVILSAPTFKSVSVTHHDLSTEAMAEKISTVALYAEVKKMLLGFGEGEISFSQSISNAEKSIINDHAVNENAFKDLFRIFLYSNACNREKQRLEMIVQENVGKIFQNNDDSGRLQNSIEKDPDFMRLRSILEPEPAPEDSLERIKILAGRLTALKSIERLLFQKSQLLLREKNQLKFDFENSVITPHLKEKIVQNKIFGSAIEVLIKFVGNFAVDVKVHLQEAKNFVLQLATLRQRLHEGIASYSWNDTASIISRDTDLSYGLFGNKPDFNGFAIPAPIANHARRLKVSISRGDFPNEDFEQNLNALLARIKSEGIHLLEKSSVFQLINGEV
jgi:hypothetical protein